ncbi:hypothetical protein KCU95_g13375, partial [Aureobasidium melanogenum]
MAVLNGLPGVEVTVVVDGEDLREYQDPNMEDGEDAITKHIAVVDGANFAMKIKVTEDALFEGNTLAFNVKVDGSEVSEPIIEPTDVEEHSYVQLVEGVDVGPQRIRRLRFSALETVNEQNSAPPEDDDRLKDLGKIEIRVSHRNVIKNVRASYYEPETGNENAAVTEEAIKGQGLTHSYSLDEETYYADDTPFCTTKAVRRAKDPAGIFVFNYRSKAALRDLMIIPRTRTPSLVPVMIKREHEDDDDQNSRVRRSVPFSRPAPKEKTIIALD